MEWYIPLTMLPGIGMIILSTSNLLIAINNEIRDLNLEKDTYQTIISAKIKQLKRLNYALIAEYLSAFIFVIGGILGGMTKNDDVINSLVISGVGFLGIAIVFLIKYSLKSLVIRQEHLNL
jgi:hypothetical protein